MDSLTNAVTYFAIQIEDYESPDAIAKLVCQAAKGVRAKFQGLEYLSTESIGGARYARFRTDLEDTMPLLDRIAGEGRGVIRQQSGTFMLRTASGRHGFIPGERMLIAARNGKVYQGTASKLWEAQFPT